MAGQFIPSFRRARTCHKRPSHWGAVGANTAGRRGSVAGTAPQQDAGAHQQLGERRHVLSRRPVDTSIGEANARAHTRAQTRSESPAALSEEVRVRVGSQNCRIVGKSQSLLIIISPIISTRTRSGDGSFGPRTDVEQGPAQSAAMAQAPWQAVATPPTSLARPRAR
jgi:hypothetical protein